MMRQDIIDAARECIGTDYRHQGRILGVGLDCVGVILHVGKKINVELFDVRGYAQMPVNKILEKSFRDQHALEEIDPKEAKKGDIFLMKFLTEAQHAAVYTGPEEDTVIHAFQRIEKVCEHGMNNFWKKRIVFAFRFKGVAE